MKNYNLLFNKLSFLVSKNLNDIFLKYNLNTPCFMIAESCTGGLISEVIIRTPGVSRFYNGCIVAYSNNLKVNLIGVDENIINKYGAVSYETAYEMVFKLAQKYNLKFCISTTGISGPTGGSIKKPVGTVYFGFYVLDQINVIKNVFYGNRQEISYKATLFALKQFLKKLIQIK